MALKSLCPVEISFARFIFGLTAGKVSRLLRVSGAGYFAGRAGKV